MATIKGTKNKDHLVGTFGNDLILGYGAGDVLLGGKGLDRINAGGGNDRLNGGLGNDILRGGPGDDTILGAAGNDRLFGDDGDDTLKGGIGNDTFDGGTGHDKFYGGAGRDTVSYAKSTMKVGVFLADANGDGGAQFDFFSGIENVDGSAFNDALEGNGEANTLRGLGDNDVLRGFGGADRLEGGDGNDLMIGGEGGDAFFGGDGTDTVSYFKEKAGVGIDLLNGNATGAAAGDTFDSVEIIEGTIYGDIIGGNNADNLIWGVGGGDWLGGAGGNDIIYGGSGSDLLDGGANNDRIFPDGDNLAPEADTIMGGAGVDWVDYSNVGSAVTVNLSANTSGQFAAGDSYSLVENVQGSDYDDTLTPLAGGRAYGGWGDDTIHDSSGIEILRGGRGLDTLEDNVGGDDGMTDIFVLERELGRDTIQGFTHGTDRFWLPSEMFGDLGHNFFGQLDAGTVVHDDSWSPTTGLAQLFLDTDTNILWYYDGGLSSATQIALLSGFSSTLNQSDFLILVGL